MHTIQVEVADLEGVQSVEADQDKKTATITFGPPASEEAIKSLLSEINYPAEG